MTLLITIVAGLGLALLVLWLRRWLARHRPRDPVEYYSGWDGYGLPLRLTNRITQDEAEAIAARGNAYLIGYFDDHNRLVRNVKMLRGAVFFEHVYTYYPSGRLSSARATNPDGVVTERHYADRGRAGFFW